MSLLCWISCVACSSSDTEPFGGCVETIQEGDYLGDQYVGDVCFEDEKAECESEGNRALEGDCEEDGFVVSCDLGVFANEVWLAEGEECPE